MRASNFCRVVPAPGVPDNKETRRYFTRLNKRVNAQIKKYVEDDSKATRIFIRKLKYAATVLPFTQIDITPSIKTFVPTKNESPSITRIRMRG